MEKITNKKKLFYFYKILKDLSGEEYPLSYEEINEHFQRKLGISITPRNVRDYVKELKDLEIDVCGFRENKQGYYLRDREFEVWELKVLIDLIRRCFFLSRDNSERLIAKIAGLHNNYTKYALKKEMNISHTPKTVNNQVPYTIDKLQYACQNQKKVRFKYYELDISGALVPRKKEDKIREYTGSPYAMLCQKNCHYIIINMDPFSDLSNYRVDRIKYLEVLEEEAKPVTEIWGYSRGLNSEEHANRCIKMFVGPKSNITLEIDKGLWDGINEELDQVKIVENDRDKDTYLVSFTGNLGEGLVRWILQMGDKARVVAPQSLVEEMRKIIQAMAKKYD